MPLQQVLLLCVPALIVGLVFRVSFMIAMPEIYYGADSNSYFEGAWKLWTQGDFVLEPEAALSLSHPPDVHAAAPRIARPSDTAVVQHLLGLVIIVGIGWIVAQMTRLSLSVGAVGDLRGGGLAPHALVRARDDRRSLVTGGLRRRGCHRCAVRRA